MGRAMSLEGRLQELRLVACNNWATSFLSDSGHSLGPRSLSGTTAPWRQKNGMIMAAGAGSEARLELSPTVYHLCDPQPWPGIGLSSSFHICSVKVIGEEGGTRNVCTPGPQHPHPITALTPHSYLAQPSPARVRGEMISEQEEGEGRGSWEEVE